MNKSNKTWAANLIFSAESRIPGLGSSSKIFCASPVLSTNMLRKRITNCAAPLVLQNVELGQYLAKNRLHAKKKCTFQAQLYLSENI